MKFSVVAMPWSGEHQGFVVEAFLKNADLWSSDEAHFHLSGTVNKQNFRYWAAENPREVHARPLHSPKVTVWCTLSSIGVIRPYFFEEGGVEVTVNANRYCDVLENFLLPKIDEYWEEHNLEDF
jgi:hypothetical protein